MKNRKISEINWKKNWNLQGISFSLNRNDNDGQTTIGGADES